MRRSPAISAWIGRTGLATLALAALAWSGALLLPISSAGAQSYSVELDEARLLPIEQPASDIIIGNPSIADVAVQSAQLLVITGKSFGTTNLIVLNAKGEEILNRNLRVVSQEDRTVRVYKGGTRFSFDCTERCETTLVPGDNADYSAAVAKSVRDKMGVAQSVLGNDAGAGQ